MRIFGKAAEVSGGAGQPTEYRVKRFPFKAVITEFEDGECGWALVLWPWELRLCDGRTPTKEAARAELCEQRDVAMRDLHHHLVNATTGRAFNEHGEELVDDAAEPSAPEELPVYEELF